MKRFPLVLLLLALLWPAQSGAWEQTQTCGSARFPCDPGEESKGIFWPVSCVLVHLNEKGTSSIPFEELERVTRVALESWSKLECSYLRLIYAGQTNETRVGFNPDSLDNANVLIFRDHDWPHTGGVLGLASVTFDRDSGEIVDTDIEFNTRDFVFTSTSSAILTKVDLQNTLTHELGHLVGLDHTDDKEATMYATAPDGEIKKRSLDSDDIEGTCAVYPVALEGGVARCNRHRMGYFRKPSLGLTESAPAEGCSLLPMRRTHSGPLILLSLGLLLLLRARRVGSRARR